MTDKLLIHLQDTRTMLEALAAAQHRSKSAVVRELIRKAHEQASKERGDATSSD